MPAETQAAVAWALQQTYEIDGETLPVAGNRHVLVDTVRHYFDDHNIECHPMSAVDLDPYLPQEN